MENKGLVHILCGDGKGKSSAAVGWGIRGAGKGKRVCVVRFLKGKKKGEYDLLSRLEPEIKLFCFEKSAENFNELTEEERAGEKQNIMNGINFAKKVITTGECDLLILDEFLGLVDAGIIKPDVMTDLIRSGNGETEIILTGINADEFVRHMADDVTVFTTHERESGKG